ncbi:C40 family peptidase, partial [Staphylococcus caeli]
FERTVQEVMNGPTKPDPDVKPNPSPDTTHSQDTAPVINTLDQNQQELVKYAKEQLGTPYKWGGSQMSNANQADGALDCSGLTQGLYKKIGFDLPRVTTEQVNAGKEVSKSEIQPGDLVFYNGTGHVAIYIGNDTVIHAPEENDVVKESPLNMMPVENVRRIL